MPSTYEPIATQTLASPATTITFSSIPSTYTDLVLVSNLFGTGSANIFIRLNSDSGANYSNTMLTGNGTSTASSRNTSTAQINVVNSGSSLNSRWGNCIMQFNNYSNTTTNKTVLMRFNVAGAEVTANVGLWRDTSAINAIELRTTVATYDTGSTFTLYGIKAA
jgi:hypothetical protein